MRKLLILFVIVGILLALIGGFEIIAGRVAVTDQGPEYVPMGYELIRNGIPWLVSGLLLAVCAFVLCCRK